MFLSPVTFSSVICKNVPRRWRSCSFCCFCSYFLSTMNVALLTKRRRCRFWVRPSLLHGRKKYSGIDFIRDLILDDQNLLRLEYRSGVGFQIFFRMSGYTFEEILNMIAPRMTRKFKIDWRMSMAPEYRKSNHDSRLYYEMTQLKSFNFFDLDRKMVDRKFL